MVGRPAYSSMFYRFLHYSFLPPCVSDKVAIGRGKEKGI